MGKKLVGGLIKGLLGKSMGKGKNHKKPKDNTRRNFRTDEKSYVLRKYKNKCSNCGVVDDLTINHIKPLSRGGTNDLDNLKTLCRACNSKKGN